MLTSRFPGEVSGADLPTLTNPAGAGDMAAGKQAIGQDGGVVTGSLPSLADMQMELDDIAKEGTDLCLSGAAAQDGILRSGDIVTIKKPLAHLGGAAAKDVAAGKTFTSAAGIAIAGTLPEKTEGSAAVVLSTESAQLVAKTQISLANNFIKLSCPNRSGDMVLRSSAPVQILALPAAFGDATAADVAAGKTFTSAAGLKATGTMPIIEGKIITLNCGQAHTIPAGCHSGSGKVEAASLASQTAGTAAAADIARGKTAWINGVKVTGKASQAIEFDITSVMLEITNLTSGSLTINANGGRETLEPFETVSMPGINLLDGLYIAGGGTSYNCTLQASGTLQMVVR